MYFFSVQVLKNINYIFYKYFLDDSTYGHKLLMKMGWNKGKGLGKNENGIKENLKVKFRNTNSGIFNDLYFPKIIIYTYFPFIFSLT